MRQVVVVHGTRYALLQTNQPGIVPFVVAEWDPELREWFWRYPVSANDADGLLQVSLILSEVLRFEVSPDDIDHSLQQAIPDWLEGNDHDAA